MAKTTTLICPQCGVEFTRLMWDYRAKMKRSKSKMVFCSSTCGSRWTWEDKPVEHGKVSTYTHYGCRCEKCKMAQKEYMRELRESKREIYV